ncbi:MAG: hypothetical protein ACK47B_00270 [Armatimonadota bacterium]
MAVTSGAEEAQGLTPVQVMARGAAAGFVATLLLSGLSRVLPGLWNERERPEDDPGSGKPPLPENPHDPGQVREWQERSQSPAAYQSPPGCGGKPAGGPPATQPAGALTQPQGPGPEGLAEQFAFKLASGVFNRDISRHVRPLGLATHFAYGSTWGILYGLLQSSYRLHPGVFGGGFGLLVYGVGPALLVPKMGLMGTPTEEPPERTWMLVAGHVIYGLALSEVFDALERRHP